MRDATDTAVIDGRLGDVGVTVGYGDRHRLRRERAACHGGECSIEEECQEKSAAQCESPDTRERGECRYLDGVPNCQQRVLCMMFVETALSAKGLVVPLRSP